MTEEQFGGDSQGDLEEIVEPSEVFGEDRSTEEVEAMQAELAQLRRQVDEHQLAARARQHRGRSWAVGLLIVFGVILIAMANLTFWVRGTVLNTDRWVAAVGPLSQNETVANAVSSYLVENLFELVDVEPLVAEALPPRVWLPQR